MANEVSYKMNWITKTLSGVITTLLIAAIIGAFKMNHQLTVVVSRLDSIEAIANEKHISVIDKFDTFRETINGRLSKLEGRVMYLERNEK